MKSRFETDFGGRVVCLHNGQPGLRGQIRVKITIPSETEGDCIDMRASDETLDRYDEVVKASGWVLDNYLPNPVVQNCHQYGDIIFTIGKALITKVEGTALVQRWQFASDVNPMAKIAYGLYKGGYLNTSSVGFIPLEWTNGSKTDEPARTYTKQELLEVSAVGIPANPNALALALKSGAVDKTDLKELSTLINHICKKSETPGDDSATVGRFHVARLQLLACSIRQHLLRA
jgi:Escherichia/Staphylococcus phage prohead protease